MSVYPNNADAQTENVSALNIPDRIRQVDGWIGTRLKRKPNGKVDKPPWRVHRGEDPKPGSKNTPDHWSSFGEALEAMRCGTVDTIGRVFTPEDDLCVVDLDDYRNAGRVPPSRGQ